MIKMVTEEQQNIKQQINDIVAQAEQRAKLVEQFKEHPKYLQYQELKKILDNGQFIEQIILNESKAIKNLKEEAGMMIQMMRQHQTQPVQQQQTQQAYTQPEVRPNITQTGNQRPIPSMPTPAPMSAPTAPAPTQKVQAQQTMSTPEETANDVFGDNPEDEIGISDDEIEGLPDFEDDEEEETTSGQ